MTEIIDESVSSTIESWTNDSLDELKQSVIKETIDKIISDDSWLLSGAKKKLLEKYLKKEWNIFEYFEDIFLENLLGDTISKEIKQFKEEITNAQDTETVNTIQRSFLQKIESGTSFTNKDIIATGIALNTAKKQKKSSTSSNENHSKEQAKKQTKKQPKKEHKQEGQSASNNEHYEIDKFSIDVPQKYEDLYGKLKWKEKPDLQPFACAMKWYDEMKESLKNSKYLTVVDFTKPNNENRFYVIDVTSNTIEYATTVWHGSGSWTWKYATSFSNVYGSYQSSLGFFRTPNSINKPATKKRTWLLMKWIEWSNDQAPSRWIYMHPWWLISQWCFTLPKDKAMEIMNKIKWDSLLFAYAKSKEYFAQSDHFDTNSNWDVLAV